MIKRRTFAAVAALSSLTVACNLAVPEDRPAERIKVDGSSTVAPITLAVGTAFEAYRQATGKDDAPITVGISGTGGGFEKFCVEEGIDISDASRTIKAEEAQLCADAGVEYLEFKVAIDALTVVVNNNNPISDIRFPELTQMWRQDSQDEITNWSDVRSGWPTEAIEFFRPGDDSGTFDYFKEKILTVQVEGEKTELDLRTTTPTNRVTPSEDDTTLIEGIEDRPNGIGFFGFAYYRNNTDRMKALAIAKEVDSEPILPSPKAVNQGQYPFSRPLFIYVNKAAYEHREEVRDFVAFYLALLMVDAGGTPTDMDSAIVDFISSSDAEGASLARSQAFLSTVGYVAKPATGAENSYEVELNKLY